MGGGVQGGCERRIEIFLENPKKIFWEVGGSYLKLFGASASCRILYSSVGYLYVSCSGSVTSAGEERANLSAIVYLKSCGFCSERLSLPIGAWDGLHCFLMALSEQSI